MTIVILSVILLGFFLIATESLHHINKSTVAMFIGVLCWVLYIGYGMDFVQQQYASEFAFFLENNPNRESHPANMFIAQNIFVRYINEAAQIVFYLLSTMSIIEVLTNNGCFDFIKEWLRTRSAREFFWILNLITFILSMNLDNLTTVCLMLGIIRVLIKEERLRWMMGCSVVISANAAGAFTVVGDATTMLLWVKGLVTPSFLTAKLIFPIIVSVLVILLLVSKKLPRQIQLQNTIPSYRGDDAVLKRWQRLLMLFVGVGGLSLVPVFYSITFLPPFVGALCVLALLWAMHELFNRTLLSSHRMISTYKPMALQYDTLQNILFVLGIFMAMSAVVETGFLQMLFVNISEYVTDLYCISVVLGFLSALFGNVCTMLAGISIFTQEGATTNPMLVADFMSDGDFWPLLSYTTALGASMLTIGSVSGFSLMKMEGVTISWYLRHFTFKVIAGWIAGLLVYVIIENSFWLNV